MIDFSEEVIEAKQKWFREHWAVFVKTLLIKKLETADEFLTNSEFFHACVDAGICPAYEYSHVEPIYFNFLHPCYSTHCLFDRKSFKSAFFDGSALIENDETTWGFFSDKWSLNQRGIDVIAGTHSQTLDELVRS